MLLLYYLIFQSLANYLLIFSLADDLSCMCYLAISIYVHSMQKQLQISHAYEHSTSVFSQFHPHCHCTTTRTPNTMNFNFLYFLTSWLVASYNCSRTSSRGANEDRTRTWNYTWSILLLNYPTVLMNFNMLNSVKIILFR